MKPSRALGAEGPPQRPISLVLVSRNGGGAQRVIARLSEECYKYGRRVRIVTNRADSDHWSDLRSRPEIVALPALPSEDADVKGRWLGPLRYFIYVLAAGVACRRYARAHPDDTLVAFLPGTALLVLVSTFGLANPVIVCERNDLTLQPMPWIVRLGRRLLYRLSSGVTVNHAGSVRAARRIAGSAPVMLVENPPPALGQLAEVGSSRIALNVGRLVPQKNHSGLLRAVHQLKTTESAEWRFRIVGDGPLRDELASEAVGLLLGGTVEFTGHSEDVDSHYRDAGFLVLTSLWEGAPNVVLEAQAHGLPVVLPKTIAGGSRLVAHGEDALVYDPEIPMDLERNLTRLMNDVDLRIRLGAAARERAARRLQRDTSGDWLRLLDSVSPAAH